MTLMTILSYEAQRLCGRLRIQIDLTSYQVFFIAAERL